MHRVVRYTTTFGAEQLTRSNGFLRLTLAECRAALWLQVKGYSK
jgi:hypothetical protein